MIWEDDRPDHDVHAGTGILIALPFVILIWTALFWSGNKVWDWLETAPCGEVTK